MNISKLLFRKFVYITLFSMVYENVHFMACTFASIWSYCFILKLVKLCQSNRVKWHTIQKIFLHTHWLLMSIVFGFSNIFFMQCWYVPILVTLTLIILWMWCLPGFPYFFLKNYLFIFDRDIAKLMYNIYKFQMYNIMIQNLYILWHDHHKKSS